MMVVRIKVLNPKRIAGEYIFKSLGEFYQWAKSNFKRPKGLAEVILLSLAEEGIYVAYTGMYSIECSYDKPIGYEAKKIARKIRFLKMRGGGDAGINTTKAIEFIKAIEKD
jgi:hypothetical protein